MRVQLSAPQVWQHPDTPFSGGWPTGVANPTTAHITSQPGSFRPWVAMTAPHATQSFL